MKTNGRNHGKHTLVQKANGRLSVGRAKPTVIGTGLIALDIVVGPQQDSVPRYWVGGTCGNVLTILAYFGWQAYPAASIGKDAAADLIIEDLNRFDVQAQLLKRNAARRTPIVVEKIRIGADGTPRHRFTWTCPSCGAWLPGYRALLATQADQIAREMPNAEVFFFDRVSRSSLMLAKACAANGGMVVFEPNGMKSGRLFHEALQISHVIKYSQERIGPLRDLDKCEGRKLEIETLGDEGLRFRLLGVPGKPARWKELGAYPISVLKDAAGAGDWCTAGVVHSLGKMGASGFNQAAPNAIEHALNVGQGLAALKCGYEGPRGMMYSVKTDQLEANLEQLIERRPLSNIADAIEAHAIPEAIKGICPSCPSLGKSETASKKAVARR